MTAATSSEDEQDYLLATVAALAGDVPLSLSEIARLTDWQILAVYGHPRDREGRIQLRQRLPAGADPSGGWAPGKKVTLEGEALARAYFETCKMFSVPREKAEADWIAKGHEVPAEDWYLILWGMDSKEEPAPVPPRKRGKRG